MVAASEQPGFWAVVDYIPLEEIEKIDWDVEPKDFDAAEAPNQRISHRPHFHQV